LLIQAVAGIKPDFIMPKRVIAFHQNKVGLLRAWIDQGAVWPDSASTKVEDKRNHWAFKAPVPPRRAPRAAKKLGPQSHRQLCPCPLEKEKLNLLPKLTGSL